MIRVLRKRLIVKAVLAILLILAAGVRAADAPRHPRRAVRVSSDGHPSVIDEPNGHSFDYFAHGPSHYNYKHPLDRRQLSFLQDRFRSRSISEIAGFQVLQLEHVINDHEFTVKILVVQRTRSEFCEIFDQEWTRGLYQEVLPAQASEVGSDTILFTAEPASGNGNWRDEHYWAFDKAGPIPLEVDDKISETQKRVLPKGMMVRHGGGFDLLRLTYAMPVWKSGDPHCCPTGGIIEIKFALEDQQLVVVRQSYKES